MTDDADLEAEQVDKSKMNFDMEGGEYELGVMIEKEMEIQLADDALARGEGGEDGEAAKDPEKALERVPEKVKEYLDKNKKELGQLDDKEWKALYDQFKDAAGNAKVPDEKEFRKKVEAEVAKKFGEEPGSDDKKAKVTDNPSEERKTNEAVEKPQDYRKQFPVNTGVLATALDPTKELGDIAANAPEHAKKAVEKNHDAVKAFIEKKTETAAQLLKEYMRVFAGQQEASKIGVKDVAVTYVPDKFADPYKNKKYANYQIPALTAPEARQARVEQLKALEKTKPGDKGARKVTLKNVCFKIAYTLDIGK